MEYAAGFEVDQQLAAVSHSLWREHDLDVHTGDFLRADPASTPPFDLVVTNPPYVRHHHLSTDDKRRLQTAVQDRVGLRVSGLAGLYVYFILMADAWMTEGGLGCWLIPAEFLDVNYGRALREYLARRVQLLRVHRFHADDVQFDDALVSSCVVLFRRKQPSLCHVVEFTHGGSLALPGESLRVTVGQLDPGSKWASYFRPRQDHNPDDLRLGDLFDIKRGLATGSNRFFIMPREVARSKGIPDEAVRPILPSPRELTSRVIARSCDGFPDLPRQLVLIDSKLTPQEVRGTYPEFWEYLEQGAREGVSVGYLASRRTPWYSQENRPAAKILCTYMGRSRSGRPPVRFIWNDSDATAANVYLLLYPKVALSACIEKEPGVLRQVFECLQKVSGDLLIGQGRVYGGSLHKLEPRELASVPVPALRQVVPELCEHRQLALFD
ncbi:MAG: Eco57I restriction-modification methylase domain-containing protein [Phycisphaerae bacterium]|nr:Eco57I restriction-modification methylase domain-containing protein [Phycisphaerae bacterium]